MVIDDVSYDDFHYSYDIIYVNLNDKTTSKIEFIIHMHMCSFLQPYTTMNLYHPNLQHHSPDVVQLIINYLTLNQLYSFLTKHKLSLQTKFSFNGFNPWSKQFPQTKTLTYILQLFPNVIVTGISLNNVKSWREIPSQICTNKLTHIVLRNSSGSFGQILNEAFINEHTKSISLLNAFNINVNVLKNATNLVSLTVSEYLANLSDLLQNHQKLKYLKITTSIEY